MATYVAGNKSARERPWLARSYNKRHATFLGYFRTREEAERAELEAKIRDEDMR